MARPKAGTIRLTRPISANTAMATPGGEPMPIPASAWPEVLTLAEAAAYLQVSESEFGQLVDTQGLPGRRIGSEWRYSRAAILDWLRRPSMKESLLRSAGSWKDDPYLDEMVKDIYRQRGRPMTEEGE